MNPNNFWLNVNKFGPFPDPSKYPKIKTRCWEWMLGLNNGYGWMRCNGKNHSTHRWIFLKVNNLKLSKKICVLHRCDNRKCCNPSHLFLGSRTDNILDMVAKGRNVPPIGERNSKHKLTRKKVMTLRSVKREYGFLSKMGRKHGVSPSTIQRAVEGTSWARV